MCDISATDKARLLYLHKAGLVAMAEGTHAYPSRTRPLRPPAPMILGAKAPGKVGRRRAREDKALLDEGNLILTGPCLCLHESLVDAMGERCPSN